MQKSIVMEPLRPRDMRNHGIFGIEKFKNHRIESELWSSKDLHDHYKRMTDLLKKHNTFKRCENNIKLKSREQTYRKLRNECRSGYAQLTMVRSGEHAKLVKHILLKHKDMQRLYIRMPLADIDKNIDQRTFTMRKERDRLRVQLKNLNKIYETKLQQLSHVDNTLKYANEFEIKEVSICNLLQRKIVDCEARVQGNQCINSAYKQMLAILKSEANHYTCILNSLNNDIEDQQNFIKYVTDIGAPGIKKLNELGSVYQGLIRSSGKRSNSSKLLSDILQHSLIQPLILAKPDPSKIMHIRKYVRETNSMQKLAKQLRKVEVTIKQLKNVELVYDTDKLLPRTTKLFEHNRKLIRTINKERLNRLYLLNKGKHSEVLKSVLANNLTEDTQKRQKFICQLSKQVEEEDAKSANILAGIKMRCEAYVHIRYCIWNLYAIVSNVKSRENFIVDTDQRTKTSYLQWPLLNFDLMHIHSAPPAPFERSVHEVLKIVVEKVRKVTKAYYKKESTSQLKKNVNKYHYWYRNSIGRDNDSATNTEAEMAKKPSNDILADLKQESTIPTNKSIKHKSAHIVESALRKLN